MDIVFDIDGTLADATHRLHYIKDPASWKSINGKPPSPDWKSFLSDEQVIQDAPMPQTWEVLHGLLAQGNRAIFITGRSQAQEALTWYWLTQMCDVRRPAAEYLIRYPEHKIFMRAIGDNRPSHIVKRELLNRARELGYNPKMAFEDRIDDTFMWRQEGLLCAQVAEGNY